jgi:rfaE bifunctional protein nucleotidyltransferase chain/domain
MDSTALKIIPFEAIHAWRDQLSAHLRPVVVTNGCFDLLHCGHVQTLEYARQFGRSLVVGLNADETIRKLKGPARPLVPAAERAILIAALECVSAVTIFDAADACELILAARPDIYVKGGDYTIDTINQEERRLLESLRIPIRFASIVSGQGTSKIVARLASHFQQRDEVNA